MIESPGLEFRLSALAQGHVALFCAALSGEDAATIRHALWLLARAAEGRCDLLLQMQEIPANGPMQELP